MKCRFQIWHFWNRGSVPTFLGFLCDKMCDYVWCVICGVCVWLVCYMCDCVWFCVILWDLIAFSGWSVDSRFGISEIVVWCELFLGSYVIKCVWFVWFVCCVCVTMCDLCDSVWFCVILWKLCPPGPSGFLINRQPIHRKNFNILELNYRDGEWVELF